MRVQTNRSLRALTLLIVTMTSLASTRAVGANWHVDCQAIAGAHTGKSWADAFTDFTSVSLDANHSNTAGNVQPGDTVFISGCDYGGGVNESIQLVHLS